MKKCICSICGFVYDEAKGHPETGIAQGTVWEDVPQDWLCPLCGASKSEFKVQGDGPSAEEKIVMPAMPDSDDLKEMSALELSALCTNLARGCDKQYKPEEAALFTELSVYFKQKAAPAEEPDFDKLMKLIEKDLDEGFPLANAVTSEEKDRGAMRALVWSEKVTRILKSLLSRYQKEGDAMLENTRVYVCTICGFVFVGNELPDICPVCKVPNWKFEKIEEEVKR